jgi:ABC-type sugar transport system permease subunit
MAVTVTEAPAVPRAAARRGRPPGHTSQMTFVASGLIPIMAFFAIFAFIPIGVVLWLSLLKYNPLAPTAPFIGLRNYTFAFAKDPLFLNALGVTLKYAIVAVPLNLLIALPIALALNQVVRFKAVFRSAFFLPTVASAVAVSLIWRSVYDPQAGWLNGLLSVLGLPQRSWLADPATALWSIMATAVWQDLGYNILILLAGLQTIPEDFHDAAKVDGGGPWQRFRDITLPLLSRTLLFVSVLTMISYLQQFTYSFVMPPSPGGPVHSTDTVVLYVYQKAFSNMQHGYASAMSVVLMGIILLVTLIQFRLLRTRWEY